MRVRMAITAAAALAATPLLAQAVKDGVDAWQRGDYPVAVKLWRPLADQGDGDAAFDLAQAYKLGRGVPADMAQAKLYYGKAARAGHAQGAANYGLLLFQDGERRAAMPWIAQAADAGDPRAQYVLGTALFNGDTAAKDWPRAYALMTRAAAAGLPQATTSLAQMDQYVSPGDRQKGLAMAATMAARPVPPLGRQLVTGGETGATPTPATPPALAATPPPRPRPVAPPAQVAAVKHPRPAPATETPARGGTWQVQLGAYGSQAAASAAWSAIAGKAAALRGLKPAYPKAGAVVRLRAAGLADRAAADRACAAAKAAGAACFPVAP